MNEIKKTYVIKKLEDKHSRTVLAKGDISKRATHSIEAIGQDGGNRIKIVCPGGFDGFGEKEVIDIIIRKSQTSLEDFGAWKEVKKKDATK